jgi:hypothetical protein
VAKNVVVLVPHDSSGIAAINFAVEYPEKVAALQILNSAYDDTPLNVWPEMIVLFAEPNLRALAGAVAQSRERLRWLIDWQRLKFEELQPASQKLHFEKFIGPLVVENFMTQPSSGPAFVQLAGQFYQELRRNSERLPLVAALTFQSKSSGANMIPISALPWARNAPPASKTVPFIRCQQAIGCNPTSRSKSPRNSCHDGSRKQFGETSPPRPRGWVPDDN